MAGATLEPLWRRIFAPCRRGVYRLLYPRPCHTAPRWIIDTYCMSQGNIPSRSPIFNSIEFSSGGIQSNRALEVVSPSPSEPPTFVPPESDDSPTRPRFRARGTPFTGSLQDFEDKIQHSTGAVLVLFHLRVWDSTVRGQWRHRKGRGGNGTSSTPNSFSGTGAKSTPLTSPPLPGVQQCDPVQPTKMEEEYSSSGPSRIVCWSVNAATHTEIAALYDIRFLPTWLGYRDGRLVGRVEGGQDEHLLRLVQELQSCSGDGETVLDCSSVCVDTDEENSSVTRK